MRRCRWLACGNGSRCSAPWCDGLCAVKHVYTPQAEVGAVGVDPRTALAGARKTLSDVRERMAKHNGSIEEVCMIIREATASAQRHYWSRYVQISRTLLARKRLSEDAKFKNVRVVTRVR